MRHRWILEGPMRAPLLSMTSSARAATFPSVMVVRLCKDRGTIELDKYD
ncbi:hypothetical protein SORBI_3005G000650 [Sorghum bicolor]|uniref:Uncharacterized protein n=1 Tax=Sorghum bicolor TaxID=4558 RepID=A0A1B6PPG1_SORBI|nr:hypothetical protein SORBI_3005G000650 [Sorghum bicolor]